MHLHLVTLHVSHSPQSVPLASAYLQASVADYFRQPSKVKVTIADFLCETAVETVVKKIAAARADVVGFSIYVWNRDKISLITHQLRKLFPQIILIGGGPETTADPHGIMKQTPFDFLMIGEGEGILPEFMQRLVNDQPLCGLQGIIPRHGDGVDRPAAAPPLSPENIPSPWLSGLLDTYIPRGVLWQLARGCSFGCEFCYDGMGTRIVRRLPLNLIEEELDYLVKHGVKQIFVLDSTFNQDIKRTKLLLRMIKEKAPQVHFHFEIRYEFLDAESAQLFSEIHCSLQIGLQSASPEVLMQVGRIFTPKEFSRKIALLNHSGATFGFDLIYGLPGDSLVEFCKSLDFALKQYPNQLDIFPLAILPGTALAEKASKLQLHHLPTPPYTILSTPTFSKNDLAAAKFLANACDIFYSRGKAVAWFNGIATIARLSPSAFLLDFADWMLTIKEHHPDPAEYNDEMIWSLQKLFMNDLFKRQKIEKLLPLALDFINYHYLYASVVQSTTAISLSRKKLATIDVLQTHLKKSAAAQLATFQYDIEELLHFGDPQIAASSRLKPKVSFAILYSSHGHVCTEPLPREYFQLLEKLDGVNLPEKVATSLNLHAAAAKKFLEIALIEGIIVPAKE